MFSRRSAPFFRVAGFAAPILNGVVVVTDDRIVAVGAESSVKIPAGARRVDLGDATLRRAIEGGYVPGPRMRTAAHSIGITGGHCDENGYKPGLFDSDFKTGIADGPEQVRAAVRYQAKYGADVIKTCATGGVLSEGDAVPGDPLKDITVLERASFVMKNGVVYKAPDGVKTNVAQ